MDYILFPDCDEFFYHPNGLKQYIEKNRYLVYMMQGFEMVSEKFPEGNILDIKTGYPMFIYIFTHTTYMSSTPTQWL